MIIMASVAMLAACQPKGETVPAIDLTDLDQSVAPGEDFYRYADGGWMVKNPLSPEYARYGAMDVLRTRNEERLNELFSSMTTMNPEKGSVDQKITDLYKQGLDSLRLNEEGAKPVMPYLESIYSAEDKSALVRELARLNKTGNGGFFGVGVSTDLMDSNMQILYIGQGGLGMSDRDYYVDPKNAELHSAYTGMLEKMFALCGYENAAQKAANAVSVEDKLARFSWSSVEMRDVEKSYNPMSSAEFISTYKGFDFDLFFSELGIAEQKKMVVEQPSYFKEFSDFFASEPIENLKDYVAGQFIIEAASSLSDDFYTASFDFFSTKLSGVTVQKPRWKRAMSVTNGILGEAVGQMYVEKYFPESYKQRVLELVKNLQTALGQHIDALEWMTDDTKAYAREKLANFTVKIGYPDKWKDYSSLNVDPALSYFENRMAANAWFTADNLSELGQAPDRDKWGMTPQTVNAYYNPTTNEICFPAAILQPPFFNADADDAVNYGAIGVVIGHEMTHGFDDQGRLFDKDGNMSNWWTEADAAAFKERTDVLVKQFNEVEILPGLFANGELSLGENIADQGGLRVAHTALMNSYNGNIPADIDGFTADQRFYIGYAHIWASNCTDEEKARRTKLDVHSLAENRVNVSLRNIEDFFKAFGIKEGDKMWRSPEDRVIIW